VADTKVHPRQEYLVDFKKSLGGFDELRASDFQEE